MEHKVWNPQTGRWRNSPDKKDGSKVGKKPVVQELGSVMRPGTYDDDLQVGDKIMAVSPYTGEMRGGSVSKVVREDGLADVRVEFDNKSVAWFDIGDVMVGGAQEDDGGNAIAPEQNLPFGELSVLLDNPKTEWRGEEERDIYVREAELRRTGQVVNRVSRSTQYYTVEGYRTMNKYLRGDLSEMYGKELEEIRGRVQQMQEDVQNIEESPPLYRSTGLAINFFRDRAISEGSSMYVSSYLSTSRALDVALGFAKQASADSVILEIHGEGSFEGIPMDDSINSELETVINYGQQLEIMRVGRVKIEGQHRHVMVCKIKSGSLDDAELSLSVV